MVIIGLVILGIIILVAIWIIAIYNKFIVFRNRMQEAWSGIDVYLKKRHDLVPNLVEVVKAYAAHEKKTFEDVTRWRSQAMQATDQGARIDSEVNFGKALGRLIAVAENYPDLKANTNFLELQKQLSALEEDLALSRRYYNGTVRENNIYVESFPSNIVAGMFHFTKGTFFEIDASEKEVSQVTF
jgi:LemA protein